MRKLIVICAFALSLFCCAVALHAQEGGVATVIRYGSVLPVNAPLWSIFTLTDSSGLYQCQHSPYCTSSGQWVALGSSGGGSTCSTCATQSLGNLASVAINAALVSAVGDTLTLGTPNGDGSHASQNINIAPGSNTEIDTSAGNVYITGGENNGSTGTGAMAGNVYIAGGPVASGNNSPGSVIVTAPYGTLTNSNSVGCVELLAAGMALGTAPLQSFCVDSVFIGGDLIDIFGENANDSSSIGAGSIGIVAGKGTSTQPPGILTLEAGQSNGYAVGSYVNIISPVAGGNGPAGLIILEADSSSNHQGSIDIYSSANLIWNLNGYGGATPGNLGVSAGVQTGNPYNGFFSGTVYANSGFVAGATGTSQQTANSLHIEGQYGDTLANSSSGTISLVGGVGGVFLYSFNGGPTNTLANLTSSITGNSGTASALAATPTQCSGNGFAQGIAANGNANCAYSNTMLMQEVSTQTAPSGYGVVWFGTDHLLHANDGGTPLTFNAYSNIYNADTGSTGNGASNTVEIENGATAQALRVYQVLTDSSDYSRMEFYYGSSDFIVASEAAGTGTQHNLAFQTGGSIKWEINSAGSPYQFRPYASNSYDLGDSTHLIHNIYLTGITTGGKVAGGSTTGTVAVGAGNLDASDMSGSDSFAKLNTCLAALPGTGGRCDASNLPATNSPSTTLNITQSHVAIDFGQETFTPTSGTQITISGSDVELNCLRGTAGTAFNFTAGTGSGTPGTPQIGSQSNIYVTGNNVRIRGCAIQGNRIASGDTYSGANSIYYSGTTGGLVEDNTVTQSGAMGIFMSNSDSFTIQRNKTIQTSGPGINVNSSTGGPYLGKKTIQDNEVYEAVTSYISHGTYSAIPGGNYELNVVSSGGWGLTRNVHVLNNTIMNDFACTAGTGCDNSATIDVCSGAVASAQSTGCVGGMQVLSTLDSEVAGNKVQNTYNEGIAVSGTGLDIHDNIQRLIHVNSSGAVQNNGSGCVVLDVVYDTTDSTFPATQGDSKIHDNYCTDAGYVVQILLGAATNEDGATIENLDVHNNHGALGSVSTLDDGIKINNASGSTACGGSSRQCNWSITGPANFSDNDVQMATTPFDVSGAAGLTASFTASSPAGWQGTPPTTGAKPLQSVGGFTVGTGTTANVPRIDASNTYSSGTDDFTSATIKVPTQSAGDNSTNAASTAYVQKEPQFVFTCPLMNTAGGSYLSSSVQYCNWTLPAGITITSFDLSTVNYPTSCSTYPIVQVWDGTSGAEVGSYTITMDNATNFYSPVTGSTGVASGHKLRVKVTTASGSCSGSNYAPIAAITYQMTN